MKFVKQHSWEQEWAETLRQEKAYLQKNLRKKDSALNRTLDRYIGLGRWDDATVMRRQIDQTARSLSGELLYMKFLQGIPLAGAVGGAYDVIYLHRIQTYARMKYHKRFLLSRKNELAFYR